MSHEPASPTPWRRALTWMRPVLALILACVAATGAQQHLRRLRRPTSGPRSSWSTARSPDRRRGNAWSPGLHKDGYATVTPALGLHGVSSDVTIVRSTLDAIAGPKILVAHSYGGFVASNASAGRSDVAGIVFTAAFVPDEGETISDLGTGYALPAFLAPPFPPGHLLFDQFGLAVIDPARLPRRLRSGPQPEACRRDRRGSDTNRASASFSRRQGRSAGTPPQLVRRVGADRIIDPDSQRVMAARAGSDGRHL